MGNLVSTEVIATKIFVIRGKRVMLDSDLAVLYGVKTKRLNEQVMRNRKRFPEDFMFQLTEEEANFLRSHFATSKRGGRRYPPYVFSHSQLENFLSCQNSFKIVLYSVKFGGP